MPADRRTVPRAPTGAGVRKPPRKETAGSGRRSCSGRYGDLCAAERCVLATDTMSALVDDVAAHDGSAASVGESGLEPARSMHKLRSQSVHLREHRRGGSMTGEQESGF